MAKKKELGTASGINIEDAIIKEFGDVIKNAEYVKNLRSKIIPITPKLDIAMGGGLQEGTRRQAAPERAQSQVDQ